MVAPEIYKGQWKGPLAFFKLETSMYMDSWERTRQIIKGREMDEDTSVSECLPSPQRRVDWKEAADNGANGLQGRIPGVLLGCVQERHWSAYSLRWGTAEKALTSSVILVLSILRRLCAKPGLELQILWFLLPSAGMTGICLHAWLVSLTFPIADPYLPSQK